MATYSHSKVSTFENCPYQYKLKYIDRVEVDMQTTIEAFMGDIVHRTLEKLYKDKKFKKLVSKATLLKFYKDTWEKEYSEDILIVKKELNADNYKKMGMKFVEDYYNRMKPFDQLTILGLETQDRMTLPNGDQWHVRIDKLACDSEGNYFVCDYKTNSRMKDQEEADSDRQLALYSAWVKDKFTDVKSVKLIWHMLAFDKDAVSERTEEQLQKLQENVVDLINQIKKAEEEKNFPTNITGLCNYCVYKSMCPSFKHQVEIEEKPIKEFKDDEGVQFVDEFSEIKNKLKELQDKQDELKKNLVEFAKQKGVDIVYGSNMKCSVKEFDKLVMPEGENKDKFIQLMKDKGIYEDCSMICYPRLQSKVLKDDIDKELKKMCQIEKDFRLSLSKRKDVEENE
ncbi:PD-(D/E)XK nuclease family protein [Candidatus Pacearchaeota archaeon]|nr:PD-(D/E)XK nuclease family protein [Candidatus Pacearchaeota archaeon]